MTAINKKLLPFFTSSDKNLPQIIGFVTFTALLILILVVHLFQLDMIPIGLYLDESSIGYNAISILQTGLDEHGVPFPVYFESVGDFKNPVYIYAAALVFKVFGVSEFTLRLTSAIFFLAALFFTISLVSRLFEGKRVIEIYALTVFGFLPFFFTLSRISFEVITQLAWVSAVNLLIWKIFPSEEFQDVPILYTVLCGVVLGTSTYTYSTARILSFLMLISIWIIYLKRENVKKLIILSMAFFASLIPFLAFIVNNPGAITSRFNNLSYINSPISVPEKILIFTNNFAEYWSLDFLIFHGDSNLRHSTGLGGVIYITILVLFIADLIIILSKGGLKKFTKFLLLNLTLSPAAAALTSEGSPHALRSVLLGLYILLLSCYTLEFLLAIRKQRIKIASIACVSFFLILEIIAYQRDYFLFYAARSVEAMGSYDLRSSLEFAISQKPHEIVFIDLPAGTSANIKFYRQLVDNPSNIPIRVSEIAEPASGRCILFHRRTNVEQELEKYSDPYTKYNSRKHLSPFEKALNEKSFAGVIRVRCYESIN